MNCCAEPGRISCALCFLFLMSCFFPLPGVCALPAEHLFTLTGGFDQPSDVAIGRDGTAYVLDGVNGRVVAFDSAGRKTASFAGTGKGRLELPMGIAVDDGMVYVADTGNHRIVIFDRRGRFHGTLPLSGEQPPEPVALLVNEGVLMWADRRNHRLCRHDLQNGVSLSCLGGYGEGEGEFRFPFQIAADRDGYLHVVDVLNSRVQVFHRRGRYFTRIGRFGLGPGELYRPNGLAFAQDGRLFVGDSYRGTISVFVDGRFQGLLSDAGGAPLTPGVPVGLAAWRDRLYVVDALGNRVMVYRLPSPGEGKAPAGSKTRASQKNCATCHLSWAAGYVPGEGEQDGVAPVATPRMCYSCHHGAVIDSRRAIGRGEQHPDVHHRRSEKKRPGEQDEIPEMFPLVGDEQLSCGSCHTPHGSDPERPVTREKDDTNPWMRVPDRKGELCHRCHESKRDEKPSRRGVNHPVGIFLKPPPQPGAEGYATDRRLQRGLPEGLEKQGLQQGPGRRLICQSCHRVHGAASETLIPFAGDGSGLCIECHRRHYAKNREEARRKGIHPVDVKLEQPVRMGSERITKITCLTCHVSHGGEPGTPLLKFDHREGKLCRFCHDGYDAVADSDHDLRVTARDYRNRFGRKPEQDGVCAVCHTLHRGDGRAPFLYAGEFQPWRGGEPALERDRICLDCHREKGVAEKAVVERFSHPARDLVLRSDPETMPLVNESGKTDEFGAIACITCHDPHRRHDPDHSSSSVARNRRGDHRNTFLRIERVKESFCTTCHGAETLLKYRYYHDEMSRESRVEYLE